MNQNEEWRPVPNSPYEVSDLGRLRRSPESPRGKNARPGRIISGTVNAEGYIAVRLTLNDRRDRSMLLHRVIASAFLGPPPTLAHVVAHGDGNPSNNHLINLRWATIRENCADTIAHNRTPRGRKSHNNKLSEDDVREIRRRHAAGGTTLAALGRRFGVSTQTVHGIVHRRVWSWLPATP